MLSGTRFSSAWSDPTDAGADGGTSLSSVKSLRYISRCWPLMPRLRFPGSLVLRPAFPRREYRCSAKHCPPAFRAVPIRLGGLRRDNREGQDQRTKRVYCASHRAKPSWGALCYKVLSAHSGPDDTAATQAPCHTHAFARRSASMQRVGENVLLRSPLGHTKASHGREKRCETSQRCDW